MTPADVVFWLGKLLGGEAVKRALAGRGLQAELRVLKKALDDSQQRRAELEGVVLIAERFAAQRDTYFAEIIRLRVENAALRAEAERLRAGGQA